MLVNQTRGGLYERFFEEVGRRVDGNAGPFVFEDQPALEETVEVAAAYGIEIPPFMAE
jgi:hypothetical protein